MRRETARALAGLSLAVGLVSILLPEAHYQQLLSSISGWLGYEATGSCPLGYGGGVGSAPAAIFFNCTIWTGDPQNPAASAFAVGTDGRFTWVGRDVGLAGAAAAGAHKLVDLGGAHVVPGLIDSHIHLINGGLSLRRLDLRGASSREQFIASICTAAGRLPAGQWLLGGNWDESSWGGEPPAASWVDACTQDTPLWLHRMDGHMGLANSAALRLAGVSRATPDPAGGVIARDTQGAPTGLLADNAMSLVVRHIPPTSLEERRAAFRAAAQHALSKGITMVHDMGRLAFVEGEEAAWEDLEQIYLPAADAGDLPLRLYSFVPLTTWRRMAERVRHVGTAHPGGMLQWGGVKDFADGSLGAHTALMHEPYSDNPTTSGTRTIELERLRELVASADAANLQVAVHAIGDRAVDDLLDIYASLPPVASVQGSSSSSSSEPSTAQGSVGDGASGRSAPRRHRIEHAQHLSGPSAAQRMAALGVVTTPNPLHLLADAAILQQRLGVERAGPGRSYAFRTILQAGVTAAFASDWPVVPLEPLGTLHAAVQRGQAAGSEARAPAGAAAAAEAEAVTYAEALRCHTLAGARAALLEQDLGAIRAGLLGDFAVLSATPESGRGAVRQTYVGGECAFGCGDDSAAD